MQQSQHIGTLKMTGEAEEAQSAKDSGALNFKSSRILREPNEGLK
jgi:hypothetical protein